MTQYSDFVAIDMGNTLLKIAYFFNGKIVKVEKLPFLTFIEDTHKHVLLSGTPAIYSSVCSIEDNKRLESVLPQIKNVAHFEKLPLKNGYGSKTLGWDRLLNAIAIHSLKETKCALAVDIGTCIKFDFVADDVYLGGSISPGLRLRFSSLHDLTANLPYLSDYSTLDILGSTTETSMRSGVINGAKGEIKHFIDRYETEYPSLTVFVTGGDSPYFDFESKNNIFVLENLTFIGLYQIYTFNV